MNMWLSRSFALPRASSTTRIIPFSRAWNSYLFYSYCLGGTEHVTAQHLAQGRPTDGRPAPALIPQLLPLAGLSTGGRLRLEPLEDRRLLAVVTVTTLADTVDFNDGVTSLREAIFATNTVPGADTIDFAPALTAGGPATILLTQGELVITDALAIMGPARICSRSTLSSSRGF